MAKRVLAARAVRPTVLVVGEGYAELALLLHVRTLYTGDHEGFKMVVGNARGKGAGHVVDYSIRLASQGGYDAVGAMLDTDTDWTAAVQKKAAKNRIKVLAGDPCLEAWLLDIFGRAKAGATADQKRLFREHFAADACSPGLFEKHVTRAILDDARNRILLLDELLQLIGVPAPA